MQTHISLPIAQGLAIIGFSCTTLMPIQFSAQIILIQFVPTEGLSAVGWNKLAQ
jgi:hypothetical protein